MEQTNPLYMSISRYTNPKYALAFWKLVKDSTFRFRAQQTYLGEGWRGQKGGLWSGIRLFVIINVLVTLLVLWNIFTNERTDALRGQVT